MENKIIPGTIVADTWCGKVCCWKNDESFAKALRVNTTFDQDITQQLISQMIQRFNVILDVGAHCGMHTIPYAFMNKNVEIYSFEPQTRMFDLLEWNVEANKFRNRVHIYRAAIGHKLGYVELAQTVSDGPNAGIPYEYGTNNLFNLGGLSLGIGGERVPMITIDSLELKACDFIKIDVEGFEPMVLKGAETTIDRYHPVIIYEYNHKKVTDEMRSFFGSDIDTIPACDLFLKSKGYSIKEVNHMNFIAWCGDSIVWQ